MKYLSQQFDKNNKFFNNWLKYMKDMLGLLISPDFILYVFFFLCEYDFYYQFWIYLNSHFGRKKEVSES